jgi:NADPH:quinone reductase-like Zn-dependent oxidoreductase
MSNKINSMKLIQSGTTYDVVFDAVGKLTPAQGKKALKPGGVYINVHADSDGCDKLENLLLLQKMIEAGKIKPVIDRVYPLEHIVEAHRYIEQGHKKGNVSITFQNYTPTHTKVSICVTLAQV